MSAGTLMRPVLVTVALLVLTAVGLSAPSFSCARITDIHLTMRSRFEPNRQAVIAETDFMGLGPAFVLTAGGLAEWSNFIITPSTDETVTAVKGESG